MYNIHPIRCGALTLPKDLTTYLVDRDVSVTFPVYAFLLTPEEPEQFGPILVDTGLEAADSAFMRQNERAVGPPGGGPDPLVDGLASHGLDPSDISTLVLTHLHHDHAANLDLFPTAEIVIQQRELAAASDPIGPLAGTYHALHVEGLGERGVSAVDGDHRLAPGVELLLTPGHSRGMQAVLVETAAGPHALIGDLAYTRHNLDPSLEELTDDTGASIPTTPSSNRYLPPGIHHDVGATYDSVERIRSRVGEDGTLISSHDPEAGTEPYPR